MILAKARVIAVRRHITATPSRSALAHALGMGFVCVARWVRGTTDLDKPLDHSVAGQFESRTTTWTEQRRRQFRHALRRTRSVRDPIEPTTIGTN